MRLHAARINRKRSPRTAALQLELIETPDVVATVAATSAAISGWLDLPWKPKISDSGQLSRCNANAVI